MPYFRDWFFLQFPADTQQNDSYRNEMGEGVWQRYLRVYGDEFDENFVPYLENFLNIIDYLKCDDKFLPLIGSILGYPPSIDGVPETYRKILAAVIAVYKVKGNCLSYKIMFNLMGLSVKLDMDVPGRKITYDPFPIVTYDNDPVQQYDSECEYCTKYRIKYTTLDGEPLNPSLIPYLMNIICFIQPINAILDEDNPFVLGQVFDYTFDETFN